MLSLYKVTFWWFSKIELKHLWKYSIEQFLNGFFTQDSTTCKAQILNFHLCKINSKQHNVMSAYFIKSEYSLPKLCFSWLLCWRFRGTNSLEQTAFWTLKTFIYSLKDSITKLKILTLLLFKRIVENMIELQMSFLLI